jgi:hypothetical protein
MAAQWLARRIADERDQDADHRDEAAADRQQAAVGRAELPVPGLA